MVGSDLKFTRYVIFVVSVFVSMYAIGGTPNSPSTSSRKDSAAAFLELEEAQMDSLRDHCAGLMNKRLNAGRIGAWRELVNVAKNYADVCSSVEDRFFLSKAYEDMAYALLILQDYQQALKWAQVCLNVNGQAVGCYARKAEYIEARASVSRGIMLGEHAIGMTKIEVERARQSKPDMRAVRVYRTRWYRLWEQLDLRLNLLETAVADVKSLQDGMDSEVLAQ